MVFGRDPRQGYFEGDRYYHPQLAFTLVFPAGWEHQDTHASVTAGAPGGRAALQLTLADAGTLSPAGYARDLVRRGSVVDAAGAGESLDGIEAWVGRLEVRGADGGSATLAAAFLRVAPDRMIQIVGRSTEPGDADEARIVASVRSFRRLTDRARLAATPDRVRLVKAAAAGRFSDLLPGLGRQALDATATSILNNLEPDEEVRPGELIKIVEPGQTR
jgi:predicted Zn-dependent protease